MRATLSRIANTELGARRGIIVLVLILMMVGFFSILNAYEKPFWYDEICTVIVSRLPGGSEIWKALDNAADTNPPLFYIIARMGHQLIPDDHLGYRLPSVLGVLVTVLCMYVILSKRVDRLSALVGAAFVLCTPVAVYAFEARPYALMLGCLSSAILAWQRIDGSKFYSFALAITLAIALSLHYYAILVWPAFILAEASVWVFHRRFRAGTWVALVFGTAPLFIFAGLLLHMRQYYAQNFWARPSLGQIISAPSYLFNVLGYWGLTFTIGAIVVLIYLSFDKTVTPCSAEQRQIRKIVLPIEDCTLTVVLLLLPMIAVVAATVSSGGMTYRYMLPAILGGALAVGYLTSKAAHAVKALLLVMMLMNFILASLPVMKKFASGSLLESRAAATREVKEIFDGYRESGFPIVISSGLQYLPMVYYMPPEQTVALFKFVDPPAAVRFGMTDSLDLSLLALRKYYPLQVEDYRNFASKYREFILVSNGDARDWWPSRLSQDGHMVNLDSRDGKARVYKVVLRPQTLSTSPVTTPVN